MPRGRMRDGRVAIGTPVRSGSLGVVEGQNHFFQNLLLSSISHRSHSFLAERSLKMGFPSVAYDFSPNCSFTAAVPDP